MADVLRCANPACGRPIERRPTGRPAAYCGPACRQAARRERLRLAEAQRQRAERPGADRAVQDRYRGATQPAVLRAREHAAHQSAPIPREVAGATAPLVTKQLIACAGRQGPTGGEAGQPASLPVTGDAGDVPGVPAAAGTQAPRAWPPWAWTVA